jgi:hypothetical protein
MTITLLLISTLSKSLHTTSSPAFSVFTSHCLVTTLKKGDPSVSALTSLLSSEYPKLNCQLNYCAISSQPPLKTQLSTDCIATIVFLITTFIDRVENTISNSTSIVPFVFIAAGTCLLIHCLETGCISPLFICLSCGHCIATVLHATVC